MKKLLAFILAIVMAASFTACSNGDKAQSENTVDATVEYNLDENAKVKNVILMIGDGMGENIIKASEIVKGDKLVMSGLKNQTHVSTYSQSVTDGLAEFTDSAASATALSTGYKTYNKYIGVGPDGEKLETICEFAKSLNMKTGLVDRHYVCHATPAGMAAHNDNRGNYEDILREMINSDIDVMFGGGSHFYDEIKRIINILITKKIC